MIAIESCGDPEKDREEIKKIEKANLALEHNLCPNDGTEMTWETPYTRRCPKCRFFQGMNVAYDGKGVQA